MKIQSNLLYEYDSIPINSIKKVNGQDLNEQDIPVLKANLKRLRKIFKNFCSIYENEIKFNNYVGFLRLGNVQFEILPKIWKDSNEEESIENFFNFFIYGTLEFDYKNRKPGDHYIFGDNSRHKSFLNMLVSHYIKSMEHEGSEGFPLEYIEVRESSKYLRGKLDIKKQINRIDKSKMDVIYFNQSYDHQLNRNLLFATKFLIENRLGLEGQRERLSKIINLMPEEISDSEEWDKREFHFNRLNERFQIPYNYADLLVNKHSFINDNSKRYYSFLYDMNKLFENFIYRALKLNQERIFGKENKITINSQLQRKNFIFDEKDEALVYTRPDIIIRNRGKIEAIIDTKYQIIESDEGDEGESIDKICNIKLKNQHLYQLFTYSVLYKASKAIMIYPLKNLPNKENEINEPNKNRSKRCRYSFLNRKDNPDSSELIVCGIPMSLSGDRKDWENDLVENLKLCIIGS